MPEQTVKINIDSLPVEVPAGSTILQAANKLGIEIPTLCLPPEGSIARKSHRPSCMVCVVELKGRAALVPACSALAEDGLEAITDSEKVIQSRRQSLEMLLSEHLGECEAPCEIACPVGWDIAAFLQLLSEDKDKVSHRAAELLGNQLPLAGILGKLCHSPCQGACRIRQLGGDSLQIQKLHLFAAAHRQKIGRGVNSETTVALIGQGAAALAAASTLVAAGIGCNLFTADPSPAGELLELTENKKLDAGLLQSEMDLLTVSGVKFHCGCNLEDSGQLNEIGSQNSHVIIAIENAGEINFSSSVKTIQISVKSQAKIVQRVAAGKRAALEAIAALNGQSVSDKKQILVRYGELTDSEQEKIFGRIDKFATFDELGSDSGKISAEAARCLGCGCAKSDDCRLRKVSTAFGAKPNALSGARNEVAIDRSHGEIILESHKCILCGACQRITGQNTNKTKLAIIGRGIHCNISSVSGTLSARCSEIDAKELADNCPTAAISKK